MGIPEWQEREGKERGRGGLGREGEREREVLREAQGHCQASLLIDCMRVSAYAIHLYVLKIY